MLASPLEDYDTRSHIHAFSLDVWSDTYSIACVLSLTLRFGDVSGPSPLNKRRTRPSPTSLSSGSASRPTYMGFTTEICPSGRHARLKSSEGQVPPRSFRLSTRPLETVGGASCAEELQVLGETHRLTSPLPPTSSQHPLCRAVAAVLILRRSILATPLLVCDGGVRLEKVHLAGWAGMML